MTDASVARLANKDDPYGKQSFIDFYCECGTKVYTMSSNMFVPQFEYECSGCHSIFGFKDSIVAIKQEEGRRLPGVSCHTIHKMEEDMPVRLV